MTRIGTLLFVVASLVACDKGPKKSETTAAAAPAAPAAPAAKPAELKGQTFGAGVKLASATSIDAILSEPKKFAGQTVRVEGMITDVCPMRGCWFEMAGDKPGQKLRFKVTDGEMVFPVESKGKRAVAEGVVAVHELSLDDTREYAAEEAREKNHPFDPASITAPMSVVRLDGTGAVFN